MVQMLCVALHIMHIDIQKTFTYGTSWMQLEVVCAFYGELLVPLKLFCMAAYTIEGGRVCATTETLAGHYVYLQ